MAHEHETLDNKLQNLANAILGLSSTRLSQKEIQRMAFDMRNNNSEKHLDQLSALFHNYSMSKDQFIFRELGVVSQFAEGLAQVYHKTPKRKFKDGDKEITNDKLINYLQALYDSFGNETFQEINALTIAMTMCNAKVIYDDGSKQIDIQILTPDSYDIILDPFNPMNPKAFWYTVGSNDSISASQLFKYYIYIDKDHMFTAVTAEGNENDIVSTTLPAEGKRGAISILKNQENSADENPYGIIPIATVLDVKQIDNYFVDKNARLLTSGEMVMIVKELSKNKSEFKQGFDILFRRTREQEKGRITQSFPISQDVMIELKAGNPAEKEEEIGYVSPGAKFVEIGQSQTDTMNAIASSMGISKSEGSVRANSSGISLIVSNDEKNKRINKDRSKYQRFESQLFEIIKKVNNHHIIDGSNFMKIPENLTIDVEFDEVMTKISQSETDEHEQHDLDFGLNDRAGILINRDPNLNRAEADLIVKNIDKDKINRTKELNDMEDDNNKEEFKND